MAWGRAIESYHDNVFCGKWLGKVRTGAIASNFFAHAKSGIDSQNGIIEIPSNNARKVVTIVLVGTELVFNAAKGNIGYVVVKAVIFKRFKVVDNLGGCSGRRVVCRNELGKLLSNEDNTFSILLYS